MPKATWQAQTIADAPENAIVTVEGNVYFPTDSVNHAFLRPSSHPSVCPWKGTAQYYDVVVNGEVNRNAAWYYAEPKVAAKQIGGRVAFWKGVTVTP